MKFYLISLTALTLSGVMGYSWEEHSAWKDKWMDECEDIVNPVVEPEELAKCDPDDSIQKAAFKQIATGFGKNFDSLDGCTSSDIFQPLVTCAHIAVWSIDCQCPILQCAGAALIAQQQKNAQENNEVEKCAEPLKELCGRNSVIVGMDCVNRAASITAVEGNSQKITYKSCDCCGNSFTLGTSFYLLVLAFIGMMW
eukprot:GHVN01040107.1.p1 GENE.GHVN01040107.1~~GHVN01040107.1.p1  ORF type:complete len:197 (-),score=24.78 GHVN01040107.1:63-653(-)